MSGKFKITPESIEATGLLAHDAYPLVLIDWRDGSIHLTTRHRSQKAVPFEEWHGFVYSVVLPANVNAEALREAFAQGEHDADISAIMDGYERFWNGNNHVAKFSEEAMALKDALGEQLQDESQVPVLQSDCAGIWDAGDWLQGVQLADIDVKATSTDEELEQIASKLDEEALCLLVVLHGTETYLRGRRDELKDAG